MQDLSWYDPKWVGKSVTEQSSSTLYALRDLMLEDFKTQYTNQTLAKTIARVQTEISYREGLVQNQLEDTK